MANYHHMFKRKGQADYEPAGYINIPPWREGDDRRVTMDGGQLYVRVVQRMDRERVIYTMEIDPLSVVERTAKRAGNHALMLDSR